MFGPSLAATLDNSTRIVFLHGAWYCPRGYDGEQGVPQVPRIPAGGCPPVGGTRWTVRQGPGEPVVPGLPDVKGGGSPPHNAEPRTPLKAGGFPCIRISLDFSGFRPFPHFNGFPDLSQSQPETTPADVPDPQGHRSESPTSMTLHFAVPCPTQTLWTHSRPPTAKASVGSWLQLGRPGGGGTFFFLDLNSSCSHFPGAGEQMRAWGRPMRPIADFAVSRLVPSIAIGCMLGGWGRGQGKSAPCQGY